MNNKLLYILITLSLYADFDLRGQASYALEGQLIDTENKAVSYATLSLYHLPDTSLAAGLLSDEKGRFTFTDLPAGIYLLQAAHLLYKDHQITVSLKESTDVGKIRLTINVEELSEVVVKGKKLALRNDLDKITLTPEKLIGGVGGTAIDLLKNVPVIRVGTEGQITLRGSSDIQVLINGKPSGMAAIQGTQLLSQIDASTIQSLEVILAPSAKNTPDGGAGIINVILKKNDKGGFSGALEGSLGPRDRYSLSPSIAFRQDKLNFFLRYNWRQQTRRSMGEGVQLRNDTLAISQSSFARRRERRNNAEFGMDYYLGEREYLTLTGTYRDRNKQHSQQQEAALRNPQTLFEQRYTDNQEPERNRGHGVTLSYQAENEDRSKTSHLTLDWVHSVEDERIDRLDEIFAVNTQTIFYDGGLSNYLDVNDGVFVDASLERPLGKGRLAWGGQYFYRRIGQSFDLRRVQEGIGELEKESFLKDRFDYVDHVSAVYGEYEETEASLLWGLGLRLEYSTNQYASTSLQKDFGNFFFNLFPSAKLGCRISEASKVLVNYNRRINRPSPNRLNPFPNIANPFQVELGNPSLKPEFVDAYNLGYSTILGEHSITFNFFWKQYHQLIQKVTTIDGQGLRIISPINLDRFDNYGWDASTLFVVSDQIDVNIGLLFFKNEYREADLNLQNQGFSQQYKLTASFRITKRWESQLSGLYQSKIIHPQGEHGPQHYLDVAFRYQIKADKAEFSLSLTDIFNSLNSLSLIQLPGLYARSMQKIDTRRLRLSLRYKM